MIRGPNPLSDCYLTDQRNFSNDINAKSRMHSEFKVDFAGMRPTITQSHRCDLTTELDREIDFVGTLTIDLVARSVKLDGKIDQFPVFEAYATVNDGVGVTLIQESPPTGNTVMNLPGKANRPISKTITFP